MSRPGSCQYLLANGLKTEFVDKENKVSTAEQSATPWQATMHANK